MIFSVFYKKMGFWVFLVHPIVVSVLLSASVERCFVSRMRDFFLFGPAESSWLDDTLMIFSFFFKRKLASFSLSGKHHCDPFCWTPCIVENGEEDNELLVTTAQCKWWKGKIMFKESYFVFILVPVYILIFMCQIFFLSIS